MKLHWSPRSPFVRKVMIAAHEVGVAERLDCVRTVVAATQPNRDLMSDNPLSRLPTLVCDDGVVLYDSPVICEYLDSLHDGAKLFPAEPPARFAALRRQALGDGFLDFLIIWRQEGERPPDKRLEPLLDALAVKYDATLGALENDADALAAAAFGIGHIAIGCALSYVDFRFSNLDWRTGHPRIAAWHKSFAARPSARATPVTEG